jgi:hypothetical protein
MQLFSQAVWPNHCGYTTKHYTERGIAGWRAMRFPLFEVIMRRHENRSTIMTSNRPLEEWGKLLGDVPPAGAILDRFLHHAQTIAITGWSYWLRDHATVAGKEDKNKKIKSKSNEPSTRGRPERRLATRPRLVLPCCWRIIEHARFSHRPGHNGQTALAPL